MNRPRYTPRKKKKVHAPTIAGTMKFVRIDSRTQIEVPVTRSDEDARDMYLKRVNKAVKGPYIPAQNQIAPAKEVPMGSLEELSAVLDDSNLVEIE